MHTVWKKFTEEEIALIKKLVKFTGLAMVLECSERYIRDILKGRRPVKSEKSQLIYKKLRSYLNESDKNTGNSTNGVASDIQTGVGAGVGVV